MKKRIKINGIIMVLAFILVLFFREIFFRQNNPGWPENFLRIIGLAVILLGQLIRVSARGYKAEHSKNSQALIEGGPYQVVRNPMYLGILLIGLGVVLILFNWWVVLFFLLIFSSRYLPLILNEEKKLRGMFPGLYEAYCRRVPRLLPRFSALIKVSPREYLPVKPAWFKKEINSIIPLLVLILLFFLWRR
ncbi:MAG: isoprenylcysteine carboxylmethyltransferase family protein [Candidatus Omnitrophica bacterium]|nr:isoprenylcysteine carboxylmethyltransferase family protein [Candidatus Omnitrophota bacterium]MDD5027671.1 isoprenylcysteine carboxylmethyltransferase family protein [Candidatus Omnitrophota bacterium]MDD5661593.1 isoprenylcysteine carboxylmethyltransferase family protein [Candidatus Omnitrophota bacterium]